MRRRVYDYCRPRSVVAVAELLDEATMGDILSRHADEVLPVASASRLDPAHPDFDLRAKHTEQLLVTRSTTGDRLPE